MPGALTFPLKPPIDGFSNTKSKPLPHYWENAWLHTRDKPLWWNPPFHVMPKVNKKIITDKSRSILFAPEWQTQPWFDELIDMSHGMLFIDLTTKFTTLLSHSAASAMHFAQLW